LLMFNFVVSEFPESKEYEIVQKKIKLKICKKDLYQNEETYFKFI
jgi:hypothetical protein